MINQGMERICFYHSIHVNIGILHNICNTVGLQVQHLWNPAICGRSLCISQFQVPTSPRQPLGFCTYFQPGSQDLYHLNCLGVARGLGLHVFIYYYKYQVVSWCRILNFKLIYMYSTIYCCSLVTISVSRVHVWPKNSWAAFHFSLTLSNLGGGRNPPEWGTFLNNS